MKKTIFAIIVFFAAAIASAREITSFALSQSGDSLVANVKFTAGETGDNHVLYIAYGASDFGSALHDWAAGGGVTPSTALQESATSASVALPDAAASATSFKAFLVNILETPAYDPDNNTIREKIRSGNGYAFFNTGYFCTADDVISATFDGIGGGSANAYPFGFRCGSASTANTTGQCVIAPFYRGTGKRWSYTAISNSSAWEWPNTDISCASAEKTVLTFDLPGKTYTVSTGNGTSTAAIDDSKVYFKNITTSTVPLYIFACNNNSTTGGDTLSSSKPPKNSFLFGLSIKRDGAYTRYYIPVSGVATDQTTGKERPVGLLWDAVGNTLLYSSDDNNNKYQQSEFFTTDTSGEQTAEVDFHAAVPAELQSKYEQVLSTASLANPRLVVSVQVSASVGAPVAKVSFNEGTAGETDRLFIAWGDGDLGGDVEDWGANIYDAGTIASSDTSKTVQLPAGIYPAHFRAFIAKQNAEVLDGVSFAEYIMVKSDGKSYVRTDYKPTPSDKYLASFNLSDNSTQYTNRYLFAGGSIDIADSEEAGAIVAAYMSGLPTETDRMSWRHVVTAVKNNAGQVNADWTNSNKERNNLVCNAGDTILFHDGADGGFTTMRITYPSATYVSSGVLAGQEATAASTSQYYTLAIFNNGRTTSTANLDKNNMPPGTKLYSFSVSNVVDSATVLARYYVPAVKDGEYGVWELKENKFFGGAKGYKFATAASDGTDIPAASFFQAVADDGLRSLYYAPVSSKYVKRAISGITVLVR